MTARESLEAKVRSGFLWSVLSSTLLRLGTLVTGIVLARILDPETFGVVAIATTVQTVLMTLSELGLAADLVRHGNIARRGPSLATLSVLSSGALTALMCLTAPEVAEFLGSRDAAPVIQVLAFTLFLAGVGVVPFARLQRELRQKALFGIELVAFVVSTGVAVGLALAGQGAMAIALGRLAAMVAVVALEFVVTRTVPRFGWDRAVISSGLRFGFPLAGAGLLSLVLLSIDNVMVGRLGGVVMLGLYSLAFNIASWPSSVIGTAIRAVAMPAFARRSDSSGTADEEGVLLSSTLAWSFAVPVSTALAVLASPLVVLLYGQKWAGAAVALTWLAALGAVRIVTDVWVAYLTASGRSGLLFACQGVWLVVLLPTMWWSVQAFGLVGAGAAHVGVALLVALPAFLCALRRTGLRAGPVLRALLVPGAAAVPAALAGVLVVRLSDAPWLQLITGGLAIVGVYAALVGRWLLRRVPPSLLHVTPALAGAGKDHA